MFSSIQLLAIENRVDWTPVPLQWEMHAMIFVCFPPTAHGNKKEPLTDSTIMLLQNFSRGSATNKDWH